MVEGKVVMSSKELRRLSVVRQAMQKKMTHDRNRQDGNDARRGKMGPCVKKIVSAIIRGINMNHLSEGC
jgi:hypothetical protein